MTKLSVITRMEGGGGKGYTNQRIHRCTYYEDSMTCEDTE